MKRRKFRGEKRKGERPIFSLSTRQKGKILPKHKTEGKKRDANFFLSSFGEKEKRCREGGGERKRENLAVPCSTED